MLGSPFFGNQPSSSFLFLLRREGRGAGRQGAEGGGELIGVKTADYANFSSVRPPLVCHGSDGGSVWGPSLPPRRVEIPMAKESGRRENRGFSFPRVCVTVRWPRTPLCCVSLRLKVARPEYAYISEII